MLGWPSKWDREIRLRMECQKRADKYDRQHMKYVCFEDMGLIENRVRRINKYQKQVFEKCTDTDNAQEVRMKNETADK